MKQITERSVIGVIGAGAMGAGIAQVAAAAGHPVLLFDNAPGAARKGIDNTGKGLDKLVARGKLDAAERDALLARMQPIDSLNALSDADLVIEAIIENLEIKRGLFAQLETICAPGTLFASNTSSISITSIGAGLKQPQLLAGMHFFNPAPVMKLVEIVSGLDTDPAVAQTLHRLATAWGKKAVYAKSTPGFIVNRLARPFYAEGLRLLEEGAADCATLDALMREAGGFRMGPFELMDLIGHDVNYAVTCSVFNAYYGDTRFQPSLTQQALVDAGRLGRKSGQGFYTYRDEAEKPQPSTVAASAEHLPETIVIEGELGSAAPLIERWRAADINVVLREGRGLIRVGDCTLALSDGRMADERAVQDGIGALALFDLALDYGRCSRLAVSRNRRVSDQDMDAIAALFSHIGIALTQLDDVPGLAVLRTVAMLANEASDAVMQGVCNAADADNAMRYGVNYPQGPLAWAEQVGLPHIHQTLSNLQSSYGEERYRPSRLLRQKLYSGARYHD
ncbi:3-hydroxyacyl-CoA dehydrogenase [Marinobacterium zhoushanense]|uniref:3-hydroxyacyl-CoA dehydrogenase n=1 Tax=Marinobacterium zhoushanense TaxID=1679163 RepID=A0ABQ1K075_9GAMM|nr:3-hydroxyacyl-CoA dehydrogenase PaaH [Marinobacterium zhoushanense]GGB83918.1 3-hydroxyacyl-CoA dehydrogenase [Marinobacterium zhoushanense]